MISFDLECTNKHRFEGIFKDYQAFDDQLTKKMIECPICGDIKIKRLFTGCSIQPGGTNAAPAEINNGASSDNPSPASNKNTPNIFGMMRMVKEYVVNNFENVGKDFADTAKAMHYGIEKERNIYGESSPQEIKELTDEGITALLLPSIDKIEN
ncbi:MAG: DUF1178 family protein [Spirochaetes bacterium]|nr:DUF1178 family protein [Spirochaetota bacterium]